MVQRFYFPLTVSIYERDDWGIDWDNPTEGDGKAAIRYRSDIENALDEYNDGDDMGQYFHGSETAKAKIVSAEWRFDAADGCLYGRVDVALAEPLTAEETEDVKRWVSGQNSDGLGEGFEQQSIRLQNGDIIHVGFWNRSDDYRIMTEEEFREEVNPTRKEKAANNKLTDAELADLFTYCACLASMVSSSDAQRYYGFTFDGSVKDTLYGLARLYSAGDIHQTAEDFKHDEFYGAVLQRMLTDVRRMRDDYGFPEY